MSPGYSGTPLAKKLGLKTGMQIYVSGMPGEYCDYFADMPENVDFVDNPEAESLDFIHLFCTDLDQMAEQVLQLKPALKKDGLMWISWPKGSSKITTDIKREPLRSCVLAQGLVDVKVCAVDDDWSGIKFVYRLKDR